MQLKILIVSLLDFYKTYLIRKKIRLAHNHALFMSLLFVGVYIYEQLFWKMK